MNLPLPTTQRERFGFYLFGIATEPYFAAAISVLMPLIMEDSVINSAEEIVPKNAKNGDEKKFVIWGGLDTNTYVLLCNAIGVLIQTFVFVSISSIADYGNLRKIFLFLFGFLGSLTCLFFLIPNQHYICYSLLAIFTNVFFGASYVFYYAYVPTLTENDPEIIKQTSLYKSEQIEFFELVSGREKVGNSISGMGFAAGYFSAVFILIIIAIYIQFSKNEPIDSYRHGVVFIGAWFLLLSGFCWKLILSRPSPPLPPDTNYFAHSWKQFIVTVGKRRQLRGLFLFLFSWFFLSDAIHSIITVSLLFAKTTLKIPHENLIYPAIIVPLAAGLGNLVLNYIMKKFDISTRKMIMTTIILYIVLLCYTILGSIRGMPFGLVNNWELYTLAVYHGFLLGPIQSFYRVQFAEILPIGKENEFFGLYEITDKGSTWLGPLVIAVLNQWFGLRSGFWFILLLLFGALIMVYFFDPISALEHARYYHSDSCVKETSKHSQ